MYIWTYIYAIRTKARRTHFDQRIEENKIQKQEENIQHTEDKNEYGKSRSRINEQPKKVECWMKQNATKFCLPRKNI